ncbi:MAG: response regulator [Halobacteriales archaeon]|nr:response regulator [Halobacteriales archaeon]
MDNEELDILLVEDNPDDAELVERALAGEASGFHIDWAERLAEAKQRIGRPGRGHGVVLLDLNLPDSAGLDTFLELHAAAPDVPIVILSGLDDEAVAREGVKRGAQDFLMKDEVTPAGLRHAIRYAIERHAATRERAEMLRQLAQAQAEAETARTRADLIAGFAHDLRTPLTPLRMGVGFLKAAPSRGPAEQEVLDLLERNVERFCDLVERILEEAGIQEATRHPQPTLGDTLPGAGDAAVTGAGFRDENNPVSPGST